MNIYEILESPLFIDHALKGLKAREVPKPKMSMEELADEIAKIRESIPGGHRVQVFVPEEKWRELSSLADPTEYQKHPLAGKKFLDLSLTDQMRIAVLTPGVAPGQDRLVFHFIGLSGVGKTSSFIEAAADKERMIVIVVNVRYMKADELHGTAIPYKDQSGNPRIARIPSPLQQVADLINKSGYAAAMLFNGVDCVRDPEIHTAISNAITTGYLGDVDISNIAIVLAGNPEATGVEAVELPQSEQNRVVLVPAVPTVEDFEKWWKNSIYTKYSNAVKMFELITDYIKEEQIHGYFERTNPFTNPPLVDVPEESKDPIMEQVKVHPSPRQWENMVSFALRRGVAHKPWNVPKEEWAGFIGEKHAHAFYEWLQRRKTFDADYYLQNPDAELPKEPDRQTEIYRGVLRHVFHPNRPLREIVAMLPAMIKFTRRFEPGIQQYRHDISNWLDQKIEAYNNGVLSKKSLMAYATTLSRLPDHLRLYEPPPDDIRERFESIIPESLKKPPMSPIDPTTIPGLREEYEESRRELIDESARWLAKRRLKEDKALREEGVDPEFLYQLEDTYPDKDKAAIAFGHLDLYQRIREIADEERRKR